MAYAVTCGYTHAILPPLWHPEALTHLSADAPAYDLLVEAGRHDELCAQSDDAFGLGGAEHGARAEEHLWHVGGDGRDRCLRGGRAEHELDDRDATWM